jgi:hypothetical protein
MNNYVERDIMALDEKGNYYSRHVQSMTSEGLHCKSDIAAELGWRDYKIDRLNRELKNSRALLAVAYGRIKDLEVIIND